MNIFTLIALFGLASLASAESYERWAASAGLGGISEDTDRDGMVNVVEFALACGDPSVRNERVELFTNNRMPVEMSWRIGISGVAPLVIYSTDLKTWMDYFYHLVPPTQCFARLQVQHSALYGAFSDKIDDVIETGGTSLFTTKDHSSAIYARNTNCWGASFDLTCVSPWNSDGGDLKGGVLVGRHHMLFSTHFLPTINSVVRFITNDNVVVERFIVSISSLVSAYPSMPDISVARLDSDLPDSISVACVLPANFFDINPEFPRFRVPAVWVNQSEQLYTSDVWNLDEVWFSQLTPPNESKRTSRTTQVVSGDSGSPVMLMSGSSAVLLFLLSAGGNGAGVWASPHIDEINTAMGDETLTEFEP